MEAEANLIKTNAPYRYDNYWEFRAFMRSFFTIANSHKNMSRYVDIDESIKKASSKKGRHVFKYYRLKNNDYGFGFIGLHSGLSAPVSGFKGSGFCHYMMPEVSKKYRRPGI